MLRMVKTLLLRQPTTFCVTLMLSAREIGLENGRPLFVLDPLVPEPTPVSGDEDRDRCSPRLPFDEADLQFHNKTHTHRKGKKKCNFSFVEGNSFTRAMSIVTRIDCVIR